MSVSGIESILNIMNLGVPAAKIVDEIDPGNSEVGLQKIDKFLKGLRLLGFGDQHIGIAIQGIAENNLNEFIHA